MSDEINKPSLPHLTPDMLKDDDTSNPVNTSVGQHDALAQLHQTQSELQAAQAAQEQHNISSGGHDALAGMAQQQQALQDAQAAAEAAAKEKAEKKRRAQEDYEARMAEQDRERAEQQAAAEAQRRALEEAHRARGEYGFTGGDDGSGENQG